MGNRYLYSYMHDRCRDMRNTLDGTMVSAQKRPQHNAVTHSLGRFGGIFFLSALISFLLLGGHFILYLQQIPCCTTNLPQKVQGIVILTGDKKRLEMGESLLTSETLQRHLFISGVHPSVRTSDMPWKERSRKHTISLGRAAYNTRENALESALWISKNGFKELALVTSDYHMPRSLAEFRRVMPLVRIYPVPVIHERNATWYYHALRESIGVLLSTLWAFLEKI